MSVKKIAKTTLRSTFPITEKFLAFLLGKQANKVPIKKPIFVIGPDRSGTSMVYAILANHPDVYALTAAADNFPDYPFSASLLRRILFSPRDNYSATPNTNGGIEGGRLPPSEANRYWKRYLGSRNGGWKNAPDDFFTEEDLDDATRRTLPQDLKKRLFIMRRKRLLLKQPGFSLKIRYLNALFPDAIFVHCLRNPCDNFLSLIKQKRLACAPDWGMKIPKRWAQPNLSLHGRTAEQLAFTYKIIRKNISEIENGLQRYVPVHYESFQTNFAQEIQKLFRGCELQLPPRILEKPESYVRRKLTRLSPRDVTDDKTALEMLEKLSGQMGYASEGSTGLNVLDSNAVSP